MPWPVAASWAESAARTLFSVVSLGAKPLKVSEQGLGETEPSSGSAYHW